MSFETESMFDTEFGHEDVLEINDEYLQVRLGEMENGEIFTGKPQLTGINTIEFEDEDADGNPIYNEDGEAQMKKIHRLRLIINNDDEEQYLDININLKSDSLVVKNIRKGSVLFDFISSIHELENAGSTKGQNIIKSANLQQYIDFINSLKVIAVKNVERKGTYHFNSFYVVQVNNKKL